MVYFKRKTYNKFLFQHKNVLNCVFLHLKCLFQITSTVHYNFTTLTVLSEFYYFKYKLLLLIWKILFPSFNFKTSFY